MKNVAEKVVFKEQTVNTKKEHSCYGCGRKFSKNTNMTTCACKVNGQVVRRYFCEGCHHEMVTKNLTIDKFYYGELLQAAVTYEKQKKLYNMVVAAREEASNSKPTK